MTNIAWGITGATHHLEETFKEFERAAALPNVNITAFVSNAAIEILRHFGYLKRLQTICNGDPYREIITPKDHGFSTWPALRFFTKEYEALLIAPCSSNTLCKLCNGIADTPVTNAAAWAIKGNLSVFVLQTHMTIGHIPSPFFVRLNAETCRRCVDCPPATVCPVEAITRRDNFPTINVLKCARCGKCAPVCPYGAIVQNERLRLNRRMIDQLTAQRLSETKSFSVLTETRQIAITIERYAAQLPAVRLDED